MAAFDGLITRLEGVAARLEAAEAGVSRRLSPSSQGAAGGPAAHPGGVAASSSPAGPAPAPNAGSGHPLSDWDSSVAPAAAEVVAAAAALGISEDWAHIPDLVQEASSVFAKAFQAERGVVEAIGQCRKPEGEELQRLVQPVAEQMQAAQQLTGGRRTDAFNHRKAVAEALQALSWVVYTGPACGLALPPRHVEDAWTSAEFFTNKVLTENRSSPGHGAWVRALKGALGALRDFTRRHAPGGPQWNQNGVSAARFRPGATPAPSVNEGPLPGPKSVPGGPPTELCWAPSHKELSEKGPAAAAAAAAAAPSTRPSGGRGGPPPPPMPPGGPGSLLEREREKGGGGSSSGAPGGMNKLFAELNKGEGVTAGLRKVTDDMKAKNRADRTGVVVASGPAGAGQRGAGPAAGAGPAKPPRTECEQGRRWVVEHHKGNASIVLEDTSPKQAVYIFGCTDCTIQVKGKVNAITVDQCTRTGVLFEDLVAACELVNSRSLQVQVTGTAATVSIDKCDGVQLYLSEASLGAAILTAKASAVNVLVPGKGPDADLAEHPLPEQFLSSFRGGRFVTEPVVHSGA